jgi:hypothetical protein
MAAGSFDIEAEHCTWIAEKEYTRDLRLACAPTNATERTANSISAAHVALPPPMQSNFRRGSEARPTVNNNEAHDRADGLPFASLSVNDSEETN